jgi:hypothetical protein
MIVLAALAPGAGVAQGASPGSTDELRLTTTKPNTSTGVFASETFNARYPNGDLKPLRRSLIVFPRGTRFDALAGPNCSATEADFKAKGLSACPKGSQIGEGRTTIVSTGTPQEAGPVPADVTIFARTDGSVMVFSQGGAYLSATYIRATSRRQLATQKPTCFVVSEQPPCRHGEWAPRFFESTIHPRSRVIHGVRHNMITTPKTCPRSGRWAFSDKHTFADGSFDLFVNHPRCTPARKSAIRRCRTRTLRFRKGRARRVAGSYRLRIVAVNRGVRCRASGYPRVALLRRHHRRIRVSVHRLGRSHRVTLAHGAWGHFWIRYRATGRACARVARTRTGAPGDAHRRTVRGRRVAHICGHRKKLFVRPFRAGT